MTRAKEGSKCDQQGVDGETLPAGEESPRGVEKPGEFFKLGGAPTPGLVVEKPGGFFNGPPSGEEWGVGFQSAQNHELSVAGQAGSLPHEEAEELLEKLAAPVPWKRGGRPTVLTREMREQVCKLLSVGLSRRQAAAYLNIDQSTIAHAAARGEEFARELQRAEELVQVPAMMSLLAASRTSWRADVTLLNRKKDRASLTPEKNIKGTRSVWRVCGGRARLHGFRNRCVWKKCGDIMRFARRSTNGRQRRGSKRRRRKMSGRKGNDPCKRCRHWAWVLGHWSFMLSE